MNNSLRDGSYPLNEISLAQTHATLCYYNYASKTYRYDTHHCLSPMYEAVAQQFFLPSSSKSNPCFKSVAKLTQLQLHSISLHRSAHLPTTAQRSLQVSLSYFNFIPYVTQFGPAWLWLTYIILSDALRVLTTREFFRLVFYRDVSYCYYGGYYLIQIFAKISDLTWISKLAR